MSQLLLGSGLPQQQSAIAFPKIATHRATKKELFPFQRKMIDAIYDHIRNNQKRVLVIAAGGAGKSFIASTVFRDATVLARKPLRCFFLVNRNCLVDQAVAEFKELGLECGILQGSRSKSRKAQNAIANSSVIVASLQTIAARIKKVSLRELLGDVGLFISDECHESSMHSVHDLLLAEYNLGTIFLGLTGSPWVMSNKKWLGQKYDVTVTAPPNPELVKLGRVVPARCFSPSGVMNVGELDIDRTGDYNEFQMEEQLTTKVSLTAVVNQYKEKGQDRSAACYCATVNHAKLQAQAFSDEGIPAEFQSGDTPLGVDGALEHQQGILTRAAQNYRLDTGLVKVLCSVGTMTTGWNLNSLGCVIFAKATKSKSLFFQSAWRGSRACDRVYWNDWQKKQDYILLDFGGNLERFGSPNSIGVNPDDYYIGEKRQYKPSEAMTKVCPECDAVISQFAKVCPECKYEFNQDEGDAEQESLDLEFDLKEWFDENAVLQVQYLRSRKRVAYRQQLSPDVAIDEFREKYGFTPPSDWHYGAIFGAVHHNIDRASHKAIQHQESFAEYLEQCSKNSRWNEQWRKFHFALEFGNGTEKSRPGFAKDIPVDRSWWEVLGVARESDRISVKRAYLDLIQEWHPDICGHEKAAEKAKQINTAWDAAKKYFDTSCA